MGIHVLVDGQVLARSRFATSAATEVLATLKARGRPPSLPSGQVHHSVRWLARGGARLDRHTVDLLRALYPIDHAYTPDFLTPRPQGRHADIDQVVEDIATTPEEIVDYHLDIALDGRPVRPEVAEQFDSVTAYELWRRPVPSALADLLPRGPRAVAEAAARAVAAFFDVALREDWPLVRSVLDADIAARAEQITGKGWARMLEGMGGLTWTGSDLTLERPFSGVVDWAHDGVLFIPSTAAPGPVQFCAEKPLSPVITYPASGTAQLWSGHPERVPATTDVVDLIGRGRREILASLDRPRTTRDLSRIDGRAESTISYHLGVLVRAGLVTKRRTGGSVSYRRTPLAEALVGASSHAHGEGGHTL